MLGKRSAPCGLVEADHLYLDYVGRDTFYTFLAARPGELFRDEDFAALSCPDNGRASVPPSLLATVLLRQTKASRTTRPRAGRGRLAMLHPQEALPQDACIFPRSGAFAPSRQLRQVAGHRLARLMQLGAYQACYVGRVKSLCQFLLATLSPLSHWVAAARQPSPMGRFSTALLGS